MDAAQRRKWLITAGLAVLVVAAIFLYYRSSEPEAPEQRFFKVNTVDTANLDCPSNDLIFIQQPQVAQVSLPTTASRAVQEQVTTTFKAITPAALDEVQTTSTTALYRFESNAGNVLAEVDLSNSGSGWVVDSFVACDSFLEDQA